MRRFPVRDRLTRGFSSRAALAAAAFAAAFLSLSGDAVAQPGGGWNPADMLRRADRNGDGRLDEGEVDERFKGFLERAANDAGIRSGFPYDVNRMTEAMDRQRREREGERGRGDDRGRGDERGRGDDRGRGDERGRENNQTPEPEPLVPGFGETMDLPAPLAFGDGSVFLTREQAQAQYGTRLVSMVDQMIERYDRDKSGALEKREWADARWSTPPEQSDLNKDGILTQSELYMRLKDRYNGDEEGDGNQNQEGRTRSTAPAASPAVLTNVPGVASQGGAPGSQFVSRRSENDGDEPNDGRRDRSRGGDGGRGPNGPSRGPAASGGPATSGAPMIGGGGPMIGGGAPAGGPSGAAPPRSGSSRGAFPGGGPGGFGGGPGGVPPFPGGGPPFPGGAPPFPGGGPPVPGAGPSFPGGGPSFPGAGPSFPGGGPPAPGRSIQSRDADDDDDDEEEDDDQSDADSDRERYVRFAETMIRNFDKDKNGTIEKSEWATMTGDPAAADYNRDGKLTKEELVQRLAEKYGGDASGSGAASSNSTSSSLNSNRSGVSSKDAYAASRAYGGDQGARPAYRFLSPVERLPSGLPDWFLEKDKNGDAQVGMYEFASEWTDEEAKKFTRLDKNSDGFISAQEALAGEGGGGGGGETRRTGSGR